MSVVDDGQLLLFMCVNISIEHCADLDSFLTVFTSGCTCRQKKKVHRRKDRDYQIDELMCHDGEAVTGKLNCSVREAPEESDQIEFIKH